MNELLEKNKDYSEGFVQPINNPIIPRYIKKIIEKEKIKAMIDLGCGDGEIIQAVKKEFPLVKITGVDISPRRINGLKKKFPQENFYIKDICNTELKKKFDFVHSSQVIEHVEDDNKMVKEIKRILSDKGVLFVSSVIKTGPMIYKYRNESNFVLDPTHKREYKNQKEFLDLFKEDFKLIKSWITPVKRKFFSWNIRIPRYYLVYGIWKKRK
jgi:2-polyprenyl-3-methyl-5-hydroxy-6-metoxy-1,4-benzoquinol methylase